MISFKEFLEIISKWSPIKVTIDKSVKIGKIEIGNEVLKIKNGIFTLGDGTEIKVQSDETNKISFSKDNSEIKSSVGKSKKEKIQLLDKEKLAFSRSDIANVQFPYLTIEKKHEDIILKFRPFLEGYRSNWDFGSLLIASTIIKLEENPEKNKPMILTFNKNLSNSYKEIGRMIYNFFRSSILETEILPHLEFLKKQYKEKARENFLSYWYDTVKEGHPKAYFMTYDDFFNSANLFKQLNWRFDRGIEDVTIYSRGRVRNNLAIKYCEAYCKKNEEYEFKPTDPYKLGFTPAVKVKVKKKN